MSAATIPPEFQKGGKYYEAYQKVYKYHLKHAGATTNDEWDQAARELDEFDGEFEFDLVAAVVKEIEREYKARREANEK